MVSTSQKNIEQSTKNIQISLEVFHHDAQKIDEKNLTKKTVIVTEGMLGKNFTSSTIHHTIVLQERKQLTELYGNFFKSAYENNNIDSLVCCIPF